MTTTVGVGETVPIGGTTTVTATEPTESAPVEDSGSGPGGIIHQVGITPAGAEGPSDEGGSSWEGAEILGSSGQQEGSSGQAITIGASTGPGEGAMVQHVLYVSEVDGETIEVEENGATIRTRETIRVTEQEMLAGEGAHPVMLPYELQQQVQTETQLRIQSTPDLVVENEIPYYEFQATKPGKLLWIFDVEMPIQAKVHANTGEMVSEQGPWWGFLVAT
jgi:hypothetical protein